jgi:hypothetical protein
MKTYSNNENPHEGINDMRNRNLERFEGMFLPFKNLSHTPIGHYSGVPL